MILLDKNRLLVEFEPEAETVIKTIRDVDGVMLTEKERWYVNFIVSGLKGIGVWDKIKALYGFVGGTAASHKWNWKDMRDLDEAFRITWNGIITHSSSGIKGDKITGHGDTHLIPLNHIGALSRGGMGFYSGTEGYDSIFRSECGTIGDSSQNTFRLTLKRPNGQTLAGINNQVEITVSSNGKGYWLMTKNSDQTYLYVNGIKYALNNTAEVFNSSLYTVTLLGVQGEFSERQCSCFHIDSGLTDLESIQMSHIITTAQGILGRK